MQLSGMNFSMMRAYFVRGVELAVHHVFGEYVTIQYCFLLPDPNVNASILT